MRYRKLDDNRDMTFGNQQADFWRDVPDAPAQAVGTRLRLISGEWFLDVSEGVPYQVSALGTGKMLTIEPMFREAILDTQGVVRIANWSSAWNPDTRTYSVAATIDTLYGRTQLNEVL
jgi:hypothetical protein